MDQRQLEESEPVQPLGGGGCAWVGGYGGLERENVCRRVDVVVPVVETLQRD